MLLLPLRLLLPLLSTLAVAFVAAPARVEHSGALPCGLSSWCGAGIQEGAPALPVGALLSPWCVRPPRLTGFKSRQYASFSAEARKATSVSTAFACRAPASVGLYATWVGLGHR